MRLARLRGVLIPAVRGSPNDIAHRIPVTLVTGFLGSGKTTLINRAMQSPYFANAMVIINEYGEVGLDHQLVTSSSDAVVVLENGCLCCTVRGDLIATLNELFHARRTGTLPPFGRVIIETSGLAEPSPVLQAFLSEPTLEGLYRVTDVVALVDAINWATTMDEHHEAVHQIALADTIVVTKTDLATDTAAMERMTRDLASINPAAHIVTNNWSDGTAISGFGADATDPERDPIRWLAAERHEARAEAGDDDHHHTHSHGIDSFVLVRQEPLAREELQFLLDGIAQNLGPGLLRVKGLVNIADEPGRPAVIQGAQHLLHNVTWLAKWPDADERTRIVFIVDNIAHARLAEVVSTISRVSGRTFRARDRARAAPSGNASG
jgi:G3E family GTPase